MAAATAATAAVSQRRVTRAKSNGRTAAAATYGVKANNCTARPRSQPLSRTTAQASTGSTRSHSRTDTSTRRRLRGLVRVGGELVIVMAAKLACGR